MPDHEDSGLKLLEKLQYKNNTIRRDPKSMVATQKTTNKLYCDTSDSRALSKSPERRMGFRLLVPSSTDGTNVVSATTPPEPCPAQSSSRSLKFGSGPRTDKYADRKSPKFGPGTGNHWDNARKSPKFGPGTGNHRDNARKSPKFGTDLGSYLHNARNLPNPASADFGWSSWSDDPSEIW